MTWNQKLHFVKDGTGDPILFVHGFGANLHTWDHLRTALAKRHEVFALDLKGFGDSPKPKDHRYSMADQARLVAAFIDRHKLFKLTLVGHSMGGGVALMTAIELMRAANRSICRLVLIDSPAYRQAFPSFIRVLRTPVVGQLVAWMLPPRVQVKRVLREVFFKPERITASLVQTYAASLRSRGGRSALIQTAKEIVPREIDTLIGDYANLHQPVLLIHGQHDTVVPLATSEQLARDLAHATLEVIQDCGHAPQEERPHKTLEAIESFLETDSSPIIRKQAWK